MKTHAMAVSAAMALVLMVTPAFAPTNRSRHHHRPPRHFVLCRPFSRRTVSGPWGSYIIRDDVFGSGPGAWRARICLRHSGGVPSFLIVRSDARQLPGSEPAGYPEILYGCAYGACSPGSFL